MTPQPSEQPRTAAGQRLMDLFIADTEVPGQLDWLRLRQSILAIEAEAAQVIDVPCVHPGCGLPERLHGAPDWSRPTHSGHWYCSRSGHPHHHHGPRAAAYRSIEAAAPDPVASPAPLDVERLARAIDASWADLLAPLGGQSEGLLRIAEKVAAEYARLAAGQPVAEEPR